MKENIIIVWLSILTLVLLAKNISNIIDFLVEKLLKFQVYLNKNKPKSKEAHIEEVPGISLEQMETFEKYVELNLIDKFKNLLNQLLPQMSEENKANLMEICCNDYNLALIIYLKETHHFNIHASKYDLEGKQDYWFNKTMLFTYSWFSEEKNKSIVAIAEYFIQNGSDPKNNNSHLLYTAVKDGKIEMVKLLTKYGADVTACDRAAILIANKRGHHEIEEYLLETEKLQNKYKLDSELHLNNNVYNKSKL